MKKKSNDVRGHVSGFICGRYTVVDDSDIYKVIIFSSRGKDVFNIPKNKINDSDYVEIYF